jgi:hypothetical protein
MARAKCQTQKPTGTGSETLALSLTAQNLQKLLFCNTGLGHRVQTPVPKGEGDLVKSSLGTGTSDQNIGMSQSTIALAHAHGLCAAEQGASGRKWW